MIYTVTFNPALDYIVRLDSFAAGEINRVKYEQVLGGGKGINVSIVLQNLGHESTALGFLAGFTGREIVRQLAGFGCKSDFVELPEGFSRINVKVKAESETEINGQGPNITPEAQAELFAKLDRLQAGDTLVKICREKYGTDEMIGQICALNEILDGDYIQEGEIILLP